MATKDLRKTEEKDTHIHRGRTPQQGKEERESEDALEEPGRTGGQAEGERNPGDTTETQNEPGRTGGQAEGKRDSDESDKDRQDTSEKP